MENIGDLFARENLVQKIFSQGTFYKAKKNKERLFEKIPLLFLSAILERAYIQVYKMVRKLNSVMVIFLKLLP